MKEGAHTYRSSDAKVNQAPRLTEEHPEGVAWLQVPVHKACSVQATQHTREITQHVQDGWVRPRSPQPLHDARHKMIRSGHLHAAWLCIAPVCDTQAITSQV
jgi:hypothetical protein